MARKLRGLRGGDGDGKEENGIWRMNSSVGADGERRRRSGRARRRRQASANRTRPVQLDLGSDASPSRGRVQTSRMDRNLTISSGPPTLALCLFNRCRSPFHTAPVSIPWQGKQFNRTLKQLLTLEAQRDKEHLPQQQQPQQQQKQPQQQHASQPQPQVKLAFLLEEDNRDRGKEGKAATSTSTAADEIRDLAASLPTPSYSSIQAGPTHYPVKKFCDITGVEAPYTDPASKLLYAHPSLYPRIRHMPEHVVAQFLAARTHLSVKKTTR